MADPVAPQDWVQAVRELRDDGHTFLVDLVCVDEVGRSDELRLALVLENPDTGDQQQVATLVPRDEAHLPGIGHLFAGAAWLQRQAHDFFGICFDGDDNRPLLVHDGGAPLRKDVLLVPRVEGRWPGALEPCESGASPGRRKLVPPGVPAPDVLADPDATPADIATSAAGARVRRR